jgi:hypothetical protein
MQAGARDTVFRRYHTADDYAGFGGCAGVVALGIGTATLCLQSQSELAIFMSEAKAGNY